jgi:hypothetical protein
VQKSRGVLYPHLPPATWNVSKHVNSPRLWPESNLTGVRKGVCPREDRSERGPLAPHCDVRSVGRSQSSRRLKHQNRGRARRIADGAHGRRLDGGAYVSKSPRCAVRSSRVS